MAYCARCDRYFSSDHALAQHRHNSSHHIICHICDRDFNTVESRRQHYIHSSRHDYCETCDEEFDDDDDLRSHYKHFHHWCRGCRKFHASAWELKRHLQESHYYCADCDRFFIGRSNLEAHRNSSIHKARDHPCPSDSCNKAFLNDGDRIAHWETDTCPSNVDRRLVDVTFVAVDSCIFTDPDILPEVGPGEYVAPTPRKWRIKQRWCTDGVWECPICDRTFGDREKLRKHLQSPAHTPRFYRCPARLSGCNAHFSALSALVRHVDSGSCSVEVWPLRLRLELLRAALF